MAYNSAAGSKGYFKISIDAHIHNLTTNGDDRTCNIIKL
jgi:hypothetical protein